MLIILMILCVVGIVVCNAKAKKGDDAAKLGAIACGVVFMVLFVIRVANFGGGSGDNQTEEFTFDWEEVQHQYISQYIAENCAATKILYVDYPIIERAKPQHERKIAALKSELDGIEVIYASPIEQGSLDWVYKAADLDSVLEANADCNVVVSHVGLPEDKSEMNHWQMAESERPALILVQPLDTWDLEDAIRTKAIEAIVITKPGIGGSIVKVQGSAEEAFPMRYVWIDSKTIDQVKSAHPKLFKPASDGGSGDE